MTIKSAVRTLLALAPAALLLCALASAYALRRGPAANAVIEHTVVLNTRILIYHCPACELVRHCGADCVTVSLSEARKRGGRPCTICGGDCLGKED